jgi:K+-sensing histidine kinase KdpD
MVDQAARTLGAAFVAMYLYRDGRIATVTGADGRGGQDGCPDLLSPGLVAMVESCYRTGRRQAVGKLFAESTPMAGEVTETSEPYGYLGLPLPSSTGAGTVGVLVLGRSGAPPWPPTEMDLMQAFAADLAELVSPSGTARDSRQSGTRQPPDSLRRDLLVDAAHALRTPLSSIKGYSSTLLQADVTWPAELHQEFLETIDREADQLTRAPNDLLLPVEPEGGPLQLGRSPATVQSLLVAAEAELAAGTGRYPVVFECEPELPPVLVDQTRMVQVIVYLTRCAGLVAAPDAVLRVHAAIKGDRTEIRFGAFPEETAEETAAWGVRPAAGTQATGGGAVPPGWVDADLMLSVCNTLLSAHGVDLRVGPPGADAKMFRFDLPPVPSPSNDTSAGP